MICSHDPDTWPTKFILTSSHYWYQHPHHDSHVMTTSGSLICHTTTTFFHHYGINCSSSKNLEWALSRVLWRPTSKTFPRSTPVLESGGSSLIKGKCPWLLQEKDHWMSHKWNGKGRRLVGHGLVWLFGTSTSASSMNHHITQWVGVMAE